MNSYSVRTVGGPEAPTAIKALVLGFVTDPVTRWCWPKPEEYLEAMPQLAVAYGGKAFQSNSAYVVEETLGAALWLPPGVMPDESALEELVSQTLAPEKQGDLVGSLEQLGAHHPEDPHWFLPLIAVDAACQGKGLGSALMERAVQRCDDDGVRAYLESSNPRNVALYERHGFRITGEVQVGAAPPFIPMIRDPK